MRLKSSCIEGNLNLIVVVVALVHSHQITFEAVSRRKTTPSGSWSCVTVTFVTFSIVTVNCGLVIEPNLATVVQIIINRKSRLL